MVVQRTRGRGAARSHSISSKLTLTGEERAWEERLRAGKRERERKKRRRLRFPSSLSPSLSVDLCAFHAETVEKGRERERERERERRCGRGESRSLRERAREGGDRALRGGYGFLADALKALAHHSWTAIFFK